MQTSGDNSVLHRIARSFGRGLALGIGFTLTEQALRRKSPPRRPTFKPADAPEPAAAPPAPAAPAPPVHIPEPWRAASPTAAPYPDMRTVRAIASVVGQRIEERAAETERKLEEVKAAGNLDMQAAVARRVETQMADVRVQLATTQREFAEAVARTVALQVAEEVAKQTAVIEARVQERIEAAVAPLRTELRELRQRLAETENTMREFTNAISDTVRMAAERGAFTSEWRREGAEATRRPGAALNPPDRRTPRQVDLRTLRQRLTAADRTDPLARTAPPPLPQASPPHRQHLVVPFRAAS